MHDESVFETPEVRARADALKELVIARRLTWSRLEAAAYVGDAAARLACARAYPPREVPAPPRRRRAGLLGRLLGRGPPPAEPLEALGDWALGLEQRGRAVALRAAVGAARPTLAAWAAAYPDRPELACALDEAEAAAGDPGRTDAARRSSDLVDRLRPDGPPPCPEVVDLIADVCWLDLALDDVATRAALVVAVSAAASAGDAAAARTRAAGGRDFEQWEARRSAAEAAAHPALDAGIAAVRQGVHQALGPWLVDPEQVVTLESHPVEAILGRVVSLRPARPAPTVPSDEEVVPGGLGPTIAVVSAKLLGHVVPGAGFVAALAIAEAREARTGASRRSSGPADPGARWGCPKCAALNPNPRPMCLACGFKLV